MMENLTLNSREQKDLDMKIERAPKTNSETNKGRPTQGRLKLGFIIKTTTEAALRKGQPEVIKLRRGINLSICE